MQAQFKLADADGDGALNESEHYDFQHPEESKNPALHAHLLAEDVRDRAGDHHKDRLGKFCIQGVSTHLLLHLWFCEIHFFYFGFCFRA